MNKANGAKYEGNFKDGDPHGQGTIYHPDGTIYQGIFEDGELNG